MVQPYAGIATQPNLGKPDPKTKKNILKVFYTKLLRKLMSTYGRLLVFIIILM